jgi:hypothetical protein
MKMKVSENENKIAERQKYIFKRIVTGLDAYPRTDVSTWDGLQNTKGDIYIMPFYHIAAGKHLVKNVDFVMFVKRVWNL